MHRWFLLTLIASFVGCGSSDDDAHDAHGDVGDAPSDTEEGPVAGWAEIVPDPSWAYPVNLAASESGLWVRPSLSPLVHVGDDGVTRTSDAGAWRPEFLSIHGDDLWVVGEDSLARIDAAAGLVEVVAEREEVWTSHQSQMSASAAIAAWEGGVWITGEMLSNSPSHDDVGFVALHTRSGERDEGFGEEGAITFPTLVEDDDDTFVPTGVVADEDGTAWVFGHADVDGTLVRRVSPSGDVEASCALDGFRDVEALVVDAQGRIYLGGHTDGAAAVARFTAQGTPDGSFGTGGLVVLDELGEVRGLAPHADGIAVVGLTARFKGAVAFTIVDEDGGALPAFVGPVDALSMFDIAFEHDAHGHATAAWVTQCSWADSWCEDSHLWHATLP